MASWLAFLNCGDKLILDNRNFPSQAFLSTKKLEDHAVKDVLVTTNLGVTYGRNLDQVEAIRKIDFIARQGEFICIVGPSGCGKTTLLKSLAGLLEPTKGETFVNGKKVDGPPSDLALVFQEYTRSLLPWLTVEKNITFPLHAKGISKEEIHKRSTSALEEVGLSGFAKKYPWQLSGGMQQRVAIARAIAYQASVLLMDEPFASVDAQTRADLEDLVLKIQRDLGVTIVFVTHDIDESIYLADRVVVLTQRPTTVKREFEINLIKPRDQITTKSHPDFIKLRAEVIGLIQNERSKSQHKIENNE